MSNVAKRINIVSIKMVKESSFQYLARQISSSNNAYEMIHEQLEGLDREQFIWVSCLAKQISSTSSVGYIYIIKRKRLFIKS